MAAIREYNAPEGLGLRPNQEGVTATAGAARRVQGAFNEAAASMKEIADDQRNMGRMIGGDIQAVGDVATKAIEHQEVSKGAAALATLHANATQQWNDQAKNADLNDPTLAPKFLQETLEPELDKLKDSFLTEGGQKWAESRVDALREHFTQKVAADQATMAGNAIAVNFDRTKNALTSTVRSDPSSVDESLGLWDSAARQIIKTSPMLTAVQVSKAEAIIQDGKESIVKSALIGLAEKSPDAAVKAVESGKYAEYISGTDAKAIIANAKQQQRASRVDENYQRHNADLQAKKVSEDTESEYLKRVYSDDPKVSGQVSTKSIVNDDRLSNPTKEKLIRLVEREMKPESVARVSAQTSNDFFARIYLPDGDPRKITDTNEITQARVDGKLTKGDFNDLRNEITNARTPEGEKLGTDRTEFFKRYAATIDGAMDFGGHSALGSQRIYQAQQDARRLESDLRKKSLDPHLVYDPRSEYFIGKPENLAKYHVSLQEGMNYQKSLEGGKGPTPNLTAPGTTITGVERVDAPAVPPAPQREPGRVYELPRGKFKWNGSGWEKP